MSGLEIAASVAAIVSAFTGATNLFRSWRSSRRNKARASSSAPRDTDVETSLVRGSQRTQQEYDADYARLGRVFAVGDERGRLDLLTHLTTLQSSVIALLTNAVNADAPRPLDLASLLGSSDHTRQGTVAALAQQFQRLSQAAPVAQQLGSSAVPTVKPLGACPGPVRRKGWSGRDVKCASCEYGYYYDKKYVGELPQYEWRVEECHRKQSREDTEFLAVFLCPFCRAEEAGSVDFKRHLMGHGMGELRALWGG